MTANLVAHSDLFRAGVATSGSYNKTLTPFGFQNERRSVWEAQSVYLKVSPFFFADKLKTPLLIMHGDDDANPGTTPLQATKLYEAIRGNGGTARLVMLPARAALVRGDGVERAAGLRDAALVRQVREERAVGLVK
jgi:dipeptidyl aminopeptidase/acylaminoacyl peptidase